MTEKYKIDLTHNGNFGVFIQQWDYENDRWYWSKLKVFYTRKEADEYFQSIVDLPNIV